MSPACHGIPRCRPWRRADRDRPGPWWCCPHRSSPLAGFRVVSACWVPRQLSEWRPRLARYQGSTRNFDSAKEPIAFRLLRQPAFRPCALRKARENAHSRSHFCTAQYTYRRFDIHPRRGRNIMLQIDNLVFNGWGRKFFDQASVSLPVGAKIGLVGRNGVGKSTLFKLILGQLHPDGGEIGLPKSARIASFDQEHPATPVSLIDTILAADAERAALNAALETAEPEEVGEVYARLIEIDADSAPSRAAEILSGLGFSTQDLTRPMSEFSGGWRMRVALAAALFAAPEMLLLDEPTNYLDLEGALWLEARLKKYPHTALIISHDRELLNNSVDAILHLSEGKLTLYTGGYDAFERRRAEMTRLQSATRVKQEAERAHLQSFIDRFKAKASKAAQAQSRVKRLAKLEPIAAVIEERVAPFTLPSPARPLAPPLLSLDGASVGYDGQARLSALNLRVSRG